jgi:hypothetical protein
VPLGLRCREDEIAACATVRVGVLDVSHLLLASLMPCRVIEDGWIDVYSSIGNVVGGVMN